MCVVSHSVISDSLRPHGLKPARLFCPLNFPGKNTGVGCHSLLHGIFPTQGSNQCLLHLLHCRKILYHLSHQGSPTFLSLYRKGPSFTGKFVFHLQRYVYFHKVKWNSLFKYSGKCKKLKKKKKQGGGLAAPQCPLCFPWIITTGLGHVDYF